jgi:hypothetical protein
LRVSLRPLPTTTSGGLNKLRMLMRRKHSLDRRLALNASGDLTGSFGTSLSVLERRDAARRRGIARSFFV